MDQREIDEERGFYNASKYFQSLPEKAAKHLSEIDRKRSEGRSD